MFRRDRFLLFSATKTNYRRRIISSIKQESSTRICVAVQYRRCSYLTCTLSASSEYQDVVRQDRILLNGFYELNFFPRQIGLLV